MTTNAAFFLLYGRFIIIIARGREPKTNNPSYFLNHVSLLAFLPAPLPEMARNTPIRKKVME